MAITALDTHQTVKDLTADLTTKADLAELRNEMKLEFAAVRREMAETKTELIKWVLGIGFAQVAMILAVLKLFPAGHP